MPRVVALQSTTGKLAQHLRERGYKVIDIHDSTRPGMHADTILCTGYHPDVTSFRSSLTEAAHISLGRSGHLLADCSTTMLNITGLKPEQVVDRLESHPVPHKH